MASTAKKRGSIESKMGRPADGSLSTYPKFVLDKIKELRKDNEGWGAMTIIVELREEYKYFESNIPSANSVHRYLKQEGFIDNYVILDDTADMLPHQEAYFVQTKNYRGFCEEDLEKAIDILEKEIPNLR